MKKSLLLISSVAAAVSGCMGMQGQSTMDNIAAATGNKPYVEAFVEYRGPAEKWSGPSTFLMRVVAKDSGPAQISITPALFGGGTGGQAAPTVSGRLPASKGMSGETARDLLGRMALSLQGAEGSFRGCLSPVRVRLVRADGIVMEKQGCRSQSSWSKAASDSVNQFITASIYGQTGTH